MKQATEHPDKKLVNWKMPELKTKLSLYVEAFPGLVMMVNNTPSLSSLTKMVSNLKETICQKLRKLLQP